MNGIQHCAGCHTNYMPSKYESWGYICDENESLTHIKSKCHCGCTNIMFNPEQEFVRSSGIPFAGSIEATPRLARQYAVWRLAEEAAAHKLDIELARAKREFISMDANPESFWKDMKMAFM